MNFGKCYSIITTIIRYKTFSSSKLLPYDSLYSIPISHSRQPQICSLSLQIGLIFLEFHIHGIIQHMRFCILVLSFRTMPLRFICVIAFVSSLFHQYCARWVNYNLFICSQLADIWVNTFCLVLQLFTEGGQFPE